MRLPDDIHSLIAQTRDETQTLGQVAKMVNSLYGRNSPFRAMGDMYDDYRYCRVAIYRFRKASRIMLERGGSPVHLLLWVIFSRGVVVFSDRSSRARKDIWH